MFKRGEEGRGFVGVLGNLHPGARHFTQHVGIGARAPRLGPALRQLLSPNIEVTWM